MPSSENTNNIDTNNVDQVEFISVYQSPKATSSATAYSPEVIIAP